MKTHYPHRLVTAAAILAATLSGAFTLGARAQSTVASGTTGTGSTTVTSSTTTVVSGGTTTTTATTITTTTAASDGTANSSITVTPIATYFYVNGNSAMFMQNMGIRDGLTAGIQDFNAFKQISDDMTMDINGHAIFGNGDYLIDFKFQKDNVIKVDVGYKQFWTPYANVGGYYSYNGQSYLGANYSNMDNELGVTRSDLWLDVQTLLPNNLPRITFHADYSTRTGQADSTSGGALTTNNGTRNILPGYYNLDEDIATISLDVDQQFDHFAYGVGGWFQHTTDNDAIYTTEAPTTATSAGMTVGEGYGTTTDAGGGHAYVKGDFSKYVSYGVSFLFDQDNYFINSGGRYQYQGTDPIYDPVSRNGAYMSAADSMTGDGTYKEWQGDLHIDWRPSKDWSIVPSVILDDYRTDMSNGYYYQGFAPGLAPAGSTGSVSSGYEIGAGNNNWFQATELLEVHYTGIKKMTHTVSAEFDEGTGSTSFWNPSAGTFDPTAGGARYGTTNQTNYTFKLAYTGVWYATPTLSFTGQYYYKEDDNNYDQPVRGTGISEYPGFMTAQGFITNDFNIRMTWRPVKWLTNIFRYDFQLSTIGTGYQAITGGSGVIPAPYNGAAYGSNGIVPYAQSGKTNTQIISENLILTPTAHFSINLNGSLVFDQTKVPESVYLASANTTAATYYYAGDQAIINADNNYFNGGVDLMWTPTDRDTFSADYTYYRAWNFVNNAAVGLPLGDDETENVVSVSWSHLIKKGLVGSLTYTFANYKNPSYGGLLNYTANGISGNVRFSW